MSTGTLARVSARTAAEVCKHFRLGDTARPLLRASLTPREYLNLLLEKQQYPDAVRFLAHALPKREAIGWACLCARQTCGPQPTREVAAALQAVEKWMADRTEENRRAAMAAGETAGFGTPAGCTAAAVFWSEGSLGPPNVAVIPPGEYLTARGVAGAILLAAVQTEPEKAPEKFRKFLAQGIDLASGAGRVPSATAGSPHRSP